MRRGEEEYVDGNGRWKNTCTPPRAKGVWAGQQRCVEIFYLLVGAQPCPPKFKGGG